MQPISPRVSTQSRALRPCMSDIEDLLRQLSNVRIQVRRHQLLLEQHREYLVLLTRLEVNTWIQSNELAMLEAELVRW
jgi:hypothetical protein